MSIESVLLGSREAARAPTIENMLLPMKTAQEVGMLATSFARYVAAPTLLPMVRQNSPVAEACCIVMPPPKRMRAGSSRSPPPTPQSAPSIPPPAPASTPGSVRTTGGLSFFGATSAEGTQTSLTARARRGADFARKSSVRALVRVSMLDCRGCRASCPRADCNLAQLRCTTGWAPNVPKLSRSLSRSVGASSTPSLAHSPLV